MPPAHSHSQPGRIATAGLLALILAGVVMRLIMPGEHPYGLYQDEAINGLDAVSVLEGAHPLYFPANNGREPFFIYLMAATVGLFGRTTLGVRAAAAICGLLTLPAAYLLGRTWGNRQVGLLSAAILAGLLWHVHLSRIGFRAVSLPLFGALALGLGAYGLQARDRRAMVGAGIAYGLSFYTYLPARFTPLALALMLAYGLIWHREWLRGRRELLVWGGVAALLAILPLAGVAIARPAVVLGRSGQVAIWNESINHGDLPGTALRSALRTLGMFTWRGDTIWRHNVPGRPIFDPLLAVAFLGGVVLGVARWRKRPALALSLIWVAVLSLPTLLAEDAPHFLRAAGVLPVVVLIPALALDAALERLQTVPCAGRLPEAGLIALLTISAGLTVRDYFGCRTGGIPSLSGFDYAGCYRSDPVRGYFFQSAATDLAREANASEGTLYLDRRFRDSFPSVRFLLTRTDDLRLYGEGETLSPDEPPLTLIAWPHTDLAPTLSVLPEGAQIGVWPGPETRGDLEPEPYRLYVRWTAERRGELPPPLGRFENGIELIGARVVQSGEELSVRLTWYAENPPSEPVQMFLHVVAEGGTTILAQVDEPPGSVYYPPLSWGMGSVIIHPIRVPITWPEQEESRLLIGLYDPVTSTRLSLVQAGTAHRDNALILPLPAAGDEQ